jgi:UDP-N-acetylmuramate dehydrogenase
MRLESAVPLAPLTTLRLGGPAARLAEVTREADVEEVAREADRAGEPLLVLGGGSNVVVADAGFGGVVVRVGAGEVWDPLVALAAERGWAGVACMSGVPGLVGATPIQNVGAYGQEVRETIVGVRAFDRSRAEWVDLDGQECGFAYRTSVF